MRLPYFQTQATSGAQTPYLVHLLLDKAVPVDREALIDGWRRRLGVVEPVESGSVALHFALPEYPSAQEGTTVPLQLAVMALEGIGVEELAACLRQSWTWPDAGEVAAHCRASLTLSDFYGGGVDRRIRLAVFHGALAALLEVLPVRALQWLPSQQVIEPAAYLAGLAGGEGLRGSAVNVRRFRRQDARGQTVQVMDTMGLGAFGLPDLQCRFTDLDRDQVVSWLFLQAGRLFDEGERSVQHDAVPAEAAAPPERWVLEVDPGSGGVPGA
jgi:hypothetical protein